jgi:dTDP-4-amino-4,6-dideoxygalactose transaminase
MDGIQAAVLSVKLPHLDAWLEARREHARLYDRLLADAGIALPTSADHSRHTYHLYVVRVDGRDPVQARLGAAGIETGVHYPTAVPFMEAYADLGAEAGDFPVAHAQMGQLLSLPMYAELTEAMIGDVCENLKAAVSRSTEVRAA